MADSIYQENIQFLRQSRGSLEELLDDINVSIDESYVDLGQLNELKKEGFGVLKKLNGYIKYLRKCKQDAWAQVIQPFNQLLFNQRLLWELSQQDA